MLVVLITVLEDKVKVDQPGQLPIVKEATIQKIKETEWVTT